MLDSFYSRSQPLGLSSSNCYATQLQTPEVWSAFTSAGPLFSCFLPPCFSTSSRQDDHRNVLSCSDLHENLEVWLDKYPPSRAWGRWRWGAFYILPQRDPSRTEPQLSTPVSQFSIQANLQFAFFLSLVILSVLSLVFWDYPPPPNNLPAPKSLFSALTLGAMGVSKLKHPMFTCDEVAVCRPFRMPRTVRKVS